MFARSSRSSWFVILLLIIGICPLTMMPKLVEAQGILFPHTVVTDTKTVKLNDTLAVNTTVTGVTYSITYADPTIATVDADLKLQQYVVQGNKLGTTAVAVMWADPSGHIQVEKFAVMVVDPTQPLAASTINMNYLSDYYFAPNQVSKLIDLKVLFPNNSTIDYKRNNFDIQDSSKALGLAGSEFNGVDAYYVIKEQTKFTHTIVTITATNRLGNKASYFFTVAMNTEPSYIGPGDVRHIVAGSSQSIQLADFFADPDQDSLTYTFIGTENKGIVNPSLQGSELIVQGAAAGADKIKVRADDGRGGSTTGEVRVEVHAVADSEYTGQYKGVENVLRMPVTSAGRYWLAPFESLLSSVKSAREAHTAAGQADVTFRIDSINQQPMLGPGHYGLYYVDPTSTRLQLIQVVELLDKQVLIQQISEIDRLNGSNGIDVSDIRRWILRPENNTFIRAKLALSLL
ncbi:hypothetical protein [Paenibacillus sp. UMB4589-SE434]|uniref:Ig-like domain-containing protein n=1 Tax=Paenibacillus sp. UMB4589-SE434 TaxID=3046314 RepID=UPI00254BCC71|nr:hypothetical protein [Paenibacillus sp. UMB4589-SE434]MDK8183170.1 hypothetical protein [Paenibacillus sp. UMB4589-SE434]